MIERRTLAAGAGRQFWARSAEHGCGWHDDSPKQAFSHSEMLAEIRWLQENNQRPYHVRELYLHD